MKSSRKQHKSATPRTDEATKARFRELTLANMERANHPVELKLDATPEGLVAFNQRLIQMLGNCEIDTQRVQTISGVMQNILRVTESGVDAVKNIEANTLHLAETVRILKPIRAEPSA